VHGSVINRFLNEVKDSTVQVVPLSKSGVRSQESEENR
jgi:hypothetical protein